MWTPFSATRRAVCRRPWRSQRLHATSITGSCAATWPNRTTPGPVLGAADFIGGRSAPRRMIPVSWAAEIRRFAGPVREKGRAAYLGGQQRAGGEVSESAAGEVHTASGTIAHRSDPPPTEKPDTEGLVLSQSAAPAGFNGGNAAAFTFDTRPNAMPSLVRSVLRILELGAFLLSGRAPLLQFASPPGSFDHNGERGRV